MLARRVFENLFNNALRYTNDGDSITLKSFIEDNNVEYVISDTGIGIEQKDLKNIFNMFYRGTNSRREEGMGIGLSVVQNIIETHRWKIDVTSEKEIKRLKRKALLKKIFTVATFGVVGLYLAHKNDCFKPIKKEVNILIIPCLFK